ncbi:MAG: L-histidine N(alpha)-methyltransferase [Planctomycetota bacterium]
MPTTQAAIRRAHRVLSADRHRFAADVLRGLLAEPKSLPCKYFYDARGSRLFDEICGLDEYYPTRTELAITGRYADDMADAIGERVALVEYGSGSSVKTRLLLDALSRPVAYIPVDISGEHLEAASRRLASDYPGIDVAPAAADFTKPFDLPELDRTPSRTVVYFPGSTIGNFEHAEAVALLSSTARVAGADGGLLVGFDLAKTPSVVHAAYNDRLGVTAEFNKNLLVRINRELEGDLPLECFEHVADYVVERGRVEIGLRCTEAIEASIAEERVAFVADEVIRTEYSHKYTEAAFGRLLHESGFELRQVWTDAKQWFAVAYAGVA